MKVLPDTSMWVDYFRGTEPVATAIGRRLVDDVPPICGPILAELVAGTPAPRREEVWLALGSLPFVELGRDEWTSGGARARAPIARGGRTADRPPERAIAAVRADASLWTRDTDVERVVEVLPELQLHR